MNQIEITIKRILKVLIYIEDHIEEEMTMEELAKIACYSPFHFHRLFQSVVGRYSANTSTLSTLTRTKAN